MVMVIAAIVQEAFVGGNDLFGAEGTLRVLEATRKDDKVTAIYVLPTAPCRLGQVAEGCVVLVCSGHEVVGLRCGWQLAARRPTSPTVHKDILRLQ